MTFNEFIKTITVEQVTTWWDTVGPNEAPEKAEDDNWKYKLSKNGKTLPFKYTVKELAKYASIDFKDFASNVANRDAFCYAFDFAIVEDLVYDNTEIQSFFSFHKSLKQTSATLQEAANYLNSIITNNQINPYKIRMALREAKKQTMIIIGMRAVFAFREENGKARIAMVLDKEIYEDNKSNLNVKFEETFNGKPEGKVLISFEITHWNDIPEEILENHTQELLSQYNTIKDTKRATWNTEANTTNSVLKYLIFKGENIDEWVKNNTVASIRYSKDYFKEKEFILLHETNGKLCNRSIPEFDKAYIALKEAYNKVEYWTKQVQQIILPHGLIKINKRPTNQANNFDGYLWSKLYPTSKDLEEEWLAFTLGLDKNFNYIVKIDTVGLKNGDKLDYYINKRGDFHNSPLVKIIKYDDHKVQDWQGLIDFTVNSINDLMNDYNFIKKHFSINDKSNMNTKCPLNQILYGPPGTGKTYNTVLEAAKIVTGNENISYSEALQVFNENLNNQIEFITFHQNYSYEDFIQGIRPDTENGKELSFEKKDGVFKRIADRALKNITDSEKPESAKKDFDAVFQDFILPLIEEDEIEVKMKKTSFHITQISEKSIEFRKNQGDSQHTLSINTLRKMYNDGVNEIILGGLQPYYNPILQVLLEKGKSQFTPVEKKNYVIIIDEINRANISRVFGELITLIEEDKRYGGKIPMRVTLPSGDSFIVPSNLYIIGTMNTADKSIALLDIALRRRFEFVPKYPDATVDGVHEVETLLLLNKAIQSRKGYDFTIGHAYFMGDDYTLENTVNKKVIPLLLEYFMNNEEEVIKIFKEANIKIGEWPLKMIV